MKSALEYIGFSISYRCFKIVITIRPVRDKFQILIKSVPVSLMFINEVGFEVYGFQRKLKKFKNSNNRSAGKG